MAKRAPLRLPVVSLSAEHLVMGHLMRRNILAYKAPPGNEGYDLICIHPDPRYVTKQVRVQVKSRYQTDCDRAFPVRADSLDAFDYLVVAFLNIGYFNPHLKRPVRDGLKSPEFYTLPADFVRQHLRRVQSGFDRVHTARLDLSSYEGQTGFDLIARDLGIAYPSRDAE
jgi:hypothetical protein